MRACYHSTTKRLERSGAKAGTVLSGVAAHNQGLRVKLLQDQPSGGLGPIEGPFEILEAGDNKHFAALSALRGKVTDAQEVLQVIRATHPGCVSVVNLRGLDLEGDVP